MSPEKPLKAEAVYAWLAEVKERRNEDGTPHLRKAQFEAVYKVACRVIHELNTIVEPGVTVEDPLLWCLHGLPGTGKSHVLKVLSEELFQELLGWEMGMEFQVVALQAVMAAQLDGDTIHHALGISPPHHAQEPGKQTTKQQDVAKRVLQWRWLIIDEISMVSARLLADVDLKLRDVVRRIGTLKSQDN